MKHQVIALTLATMVSMSQAATSKQVKDYLYDIVKQKGGSVKSIQFMPRKTAPGLDGWEILPFSLEIDSGRSTSTINDAVFVKGDFITDNFINIANKTDMKSSLSKTPDASYYTKFNLVAGNINAKNKVVVFSDPLCPICKEILPEMISLAKKHPKEISIFLYHYPIESLHPASSAIIKSMIFAKSKGLDVSSLFYSYEFKNDGKDIGRVLVEINNVLKSAGVKMSIKKADLTSRIVLAEYNNEQRKAAELTISGTPSIYTNGKADHGRKVLSELSKSF
jgi:thiol:disulfide interchange protein DsbC